MGRAGRVRRPRRRVPRGSALNLAEICVRLRAAGCVFAEEEARLLAACGADGGELERLVARREQGEPLETVLGWVEFLGRRLEVASGVFVPRRRTELLARLAREHAGSDSVFLEMCCGVAPVAAVVEARECHVSDLSERALALAARNAPEASPHLGDLFAALPRSLRGGFDVIAANAPYVPSDAIASMPPEARVHEPRLALDGGTDGVVLHRRITREAGHWLVSGGILLVETSPVQVNLTLQAFADAGLVAAAIHDEEVDACVVRGVRPGARA